jgi:peptidyl-tRNA hydrolase, PTH1 family
MADDVWLVVGLGNPGPEYETTRHNAGQLVADILADRMGGRFKAHRTHSMVVEGQLLGHRIVLAKPRSYMNLSGGVVNRLREYYKVDLDRIVVVHDELDIPFGTLRLKQGGGDNGHNGLKSVTKALGSPDYLRVRIGIGRPPGTLDPAVFVLRDFGPAERKEVGLHLERAADAVETLLTDGLDRAQNAYHT